MRMITLTEFLLARFAEEEAVARRASSEPLGDLGVLRSRIFAALIDDTDDALNGWVQFQPDRVLADCAAKRCIVELHPLIATTEHVRSPGAPAGYEDLTVDVRCQTCDPDGHADEGPCLTLRALALPYAGHPDYREEWRP